MILSAKILVCIGSGGVGKTTVAASLGVWGAKQGKKVLVLTVDPARRLASTLGLKPDGTEQRVLLADHKISGELWASVLNSKQIFDDFVLRAAAKGADAQSIFKNKLYQQLSTTLSGSQEFTALEKLYSAYESGKYDLIILDTPPTKHAIDFLKAPQKISSLFSESIVQWFRFSKKTPWFQQIFQLSAQKAFQILQTLTGSEFVLELQAFFKTIESWQSKLEGRTVKVNELLLSSETSFNLVTAYDRAKVEEAKAFVAELRKSGYHLDFMTINRSFPNWLPKSFQTNSVADHYCKKLNDYYEARLHSLLDMTNSIKDLDILMLPEYDHDIADIKGLVQLVEDYKWVEIQKSKS